MSKLYQIKEVIDVSVPNLENTAPLTSPIESNQVGGLSPQVESSAILPDNQEKVSEIIIECVSLNTDFNIVTIIRSYSQGLHLFEVQQTLSQTRLKKQIM